MGGKQNLTHEGSSSTILENSPMVALQTPTACGGSSVDIQFFCE